MGIFRYRCGVGIERGEELSKLLEMVSERKVLRS